MATVYQQATIAVSPDELWAQVSDVGNVSAFIDVVAESSLDGDVRRTTLADGAKFSERILGIDDEHRRVAYTIQRSPLPIEFHAASMQVLDAGDGKCTFVWIADVKPDEFAEALTGLMGGEIAKIKARY